MQESQNCRSLVRGRGTDHPRRRIPRAQCLLACCARRPRVSRVHADGECTAEAGRVYRRIPYGPLLDVLLTDMRSYRGPNERQLDEDVAADSRWFGPAQLAWLKRELMNLRATWKVIATGCRLAL